MRKGRRAKIAKGLRFAVFMRDNFMCVYCGQETTPGADDPRENATIDHLECWADYGPDTEQNLVTACEHHNKSRGRKPWLVFADAAAKARIVAAVDRPIDRKAALRFAAAFNALRPPAAKRTRKRKAVA